MSSLKNSKLILWFSVLFLLQGIIFFYWGFKKSYIHMDEAYSLGLTHYKSVEIQENEDFYDTWHSGSYYEEYLVPKKTDSYKKIYENQRDDVHPPFYYFLLRIAQGFTNEFSVWPGILFNILISFGNTFVLFLVLKNLWKENSLKKSFLLAGVAGITLSSISSVIYIRMYTITTLFVLLITYFHIKIWEDSTSLKSYVGVFLTSLLGSLTHYYFLFYLFFLFVCFLISFVRNKNWKALKGYFFSIFLAAICSLVIFPYSIKHMFFGYRGDGAIQKLFQPSTFLFQFGAYFMKLNQYTFHYFLIPILIFLCGLWIVSKKKNLRTPFKSKMESILCWSLCGTFLFISLMSPYIELRYILPICSLIFVFVIHFFYEYFKLLVPKFYKKCFAILCVFVVCTSIFFSMQPELVYPYHKTIVQKFKDNTSILAIYFLDMQNNRFLDDILLFSILENSYISQRLDFEEEELIAVFKGKDLSSGMYVFLNQSERKKEFLEKIKDILHFESVEHIFQLNACNIYYFS